MAKITGEIKNELQGILKAFKGYKSLLWTNYRLQKVLNDDLLSIMEEEASKFTSTQARRDNKDMAISLNYLIKIVEHQSQLYTFEVDRKANKDQDLVDQYKKLLSVDTHMHNGNKSYNGSKSVLVEIYQDRKNNLKLRPVTNDKFFVYSNDKFEPNRPTHYIKIMCMETIGEGINKKEVELLHIYTDNEFMEVLADGTIKSYIVNKYGVAPFVYVNKEMYKIMPTAGRDTLQTLIQLNSILTNAVVCSFYQGHPIRILKNVDQERSAISINPNDFVVLNSKEGSELSPELDELASSLDISKSLELYKQVLEHLLHINGIKPKDATTQGASGVAIQLKDNDILENRKDQIEQWRPAEEELWEKIALVHNAMIENKMAGPKTPAKKFSKDFAVEVEFQLPDTNSQIQNDDGQANADKPSDSAKSTATDPSTGA